MLLLAYVFENFHSSAKLSLTSHSIYQLALANNYITPASLSWEALLKKANIKLEIFKDNCMHIFVKNGIRAGSSLEYSDGGKKIIPKKL